MASAGPKPILFEWLTAMRSVNLTGDGKVFTSTEMGILLMAATHADTNTGRKIHPGITLLAREAGSKPHTATATLAKARQLNVLERVSEGRRGSHMADEYALVPPGRWRVDATTGMQVDATTGMQVDATTGMQVDATTGMQVDATTGMQVDATTGMQVDATTGIPTTHVTTHVATTHSSTAPAEVEDEFQRNLLECPSFEDEDEDRLDVQTEDVVQLPPRIYRDRDAGYAENSHRREGDEQGFDHDSGEYLSADRTPSYIRPRRHLG